MNRIRLMAGTRQAGGAQSLGSLTLFIVTRCLSSTRIAGEVETGAQVRHQWSAATPGLGHSSCQNVQNIGKLNLVWERKDH